MHDLSTILEKTWAWSSKKINMLIERNMESCVIFKKSYNHRNDSQNNTPSFQSKSKFCKMMTCHVTECCFYHKWMFPFRRVNAWGELNICDEEVTTTTWNNLHINKMSSYFPIGIQKNKTGNWKPLTHRENCLEIIPDLQPFHWLKMTTVRCLSVISKYGTVWWRFRNTLQNYGYYRLFMK